MITTEYEAEVAARQWRDVRAVMGVAAVGSVLPRGLMAVIRLQRTTAPLEMESASTWDGRLPPDVSLDAQADTFRDRWTDVVAHTCETCKHWYYSEEAPDGWGECERAAGAHGEPSAETLAYALDDYAYKAWLITNTAFGCVMWEEDKDALKALDVLRGEA